MGSLPKPSRTVPAMAVQPNSFTYTLSAGNRCVKALKSSCAGMFGSDIFVVFLQFVEKIYGCRVSNRLDYARCYIECRFLYKSKIMLGSI